MLLARGARINATNRGDDTPLHLAAAHGHRDIVYMVSRQVVNRIWLKYNAQYKLSSDFILTHLSM